MIMGRKEKQEKSERLGKLLHMILNKEKERGTRASVMDDYYINQQTIHHC